MTSSGEEEGSFRFNNVDFSDRVLRLEITPVSELGSVDLKIKMIHINSLMLAYKSQFFYKLFKNGMKETQQIGEVALRINESEEAAFMDILKFIYDQSVDASSAPDLVGVLMAADKFEVPSCVKYCVDLLFKFPMSTKLARVYLELPSSTMANEVVQPLIGSAKSYIRAHYMDLTKFQEEMMGLPLGAVELVLGVDDLQVDSEDAVLDIVLKWGRLRYPELEERREILTRLLVKFVSLPNMTSLKLKDVLDCSDFDSERVWKPVVDALFSKFQDVPTEKYEYPRRIYNRRIEVKVVQLQFAHPRCLVYFDLSKKECADLIPFERRYYQMFFLGGHKLSLFAQTEKEQGPLGLHLVVMEGSESCTLAFGFSAMKKSSNEFTSLIHTNKSVFLRNKARGFDDPFSIPWKKFMSEESEYFIDGILHLQADIILLG